MPKLKPLAEDAIPKAMIRAKHYRLLNEPWDAESICRDILRIIPGHQEALLTLILSITDQFGSDTTAHAPEAMKLCKNLESEYEQLYYRGLIEERLGKSTLKRSTPRVKYIAYEHYKDAMNLYERAEKIHPENNQDALLRWNACFRGIEEHRLCASPDANEPHMF